MLNMPRDEFEAQRVWIFRDDTTWAAAVAFRSCGHFCRMQFSAPSGLATACCRCSQHQGQCEICVNP